MVGLRDPAIDDFDRVIKRAFDLVISTFTLLVAWPIMLVIAVVIKLGSPGPVLFVQERVGENGQPFRIFKFRSMVVDAEQLAPIVTQEDDTGVLVHKVPDDPRITRVGRFIRRISLDELPSFSTCCAGR